MNKNKEQLLAIMADNSISYVIEGKEAYIKLANQQYNTIQTTVVEGVEELDIEGDKKRTLWWVDLNMCGHQQVVERAEQGAEIRAAGRT
ncbi:hypothetical protein ASC94_03180 [Massilia sp. Root418]|uniref:hypothetical protein n=1 Tax=Massilia sp. Root418 TaxID=1736532 RepID=UPI0006FC28A8|nr:hypothetical protein [Massilia sp. Root418]KQX01625.1 hypothetical protein ASC94_03180 [Massilia sp. Root418]